MNKNIRNFSIIAHIDHGKSTLADRLLEFTNTIDKRELQEQMLDQMDLEKERGITIKLNAVQLKYKEYIFNLIDTPGHVDFNYEVSRSLAACQGALLVVDATQGIQSQTIANTYLAIDNNLEIIPIINKIDLPNANISEVKEQIKDLLGQSYGDIPLISSKTGKNIDLVIDAIINRIPPPSTTNTNKLQALIFDSYFDPYRGVIIFIQLKSSKISKGDKIHFIKANFDAEITSIGIKAPFEKEQESLGEGEVGWISCNIKDIKKIKIGDTITRTNDKAEALPGYVPIKPMVFCSMYPIDGTDFVALGKAIEKISLSDSSLIYEKTSSNSLGFGYRMGFLGMLHLEIIQQRIEREFNLDLVSTSPSIKYKIILHNGESMMISDPVQFPPMSKISKILEPIVKIKIMTPIKYMGTIMEMCHSKRAKYIETIDVDKSHQQLNYLMPLSEVVFDFFDTLKSITKGYASFDYEFDNYMEANLTKIDVLLNKKVVNDLSIISHRDDAYYKGRELVKKLKEIIPRENFEIPVQASIGNKVIARETIKAYRKNVTGHLYGGDVTRKKKLLEKQKKGKKKMKSIGSVNIPQEAFMSMVNIKNSK